MSSEPLSTLRLTSLLLPGHLLPQALLRLPHFAGWVARREVLRLEYLPYLHFGPAIERSTLEPVDRFLLGIHFPEPEAGNQLLRFRERAVSNDPPVTVELYPRAFRARLEPFA